MLPTEVGPSVSCRFFHALGLTVEAVLSVEFTDSTDEDDLADCNGENDPSSEQKEASNFSLSAKGTGAEVQCNTFSLQ